MHTNTATHHTNVGFTIVELLIVIVVIAILAAISVVAYVGIQNSANDSAVQSDLTNFGRAIEVFHASEGRYPQPYSDADLSKLNLSPTRGAYGNHLLSGGRWYNLLICTSDSAEAPGFVIAAASKSGKVFINSTSSGLTVYDTSLRSRLVLCPEYGLSTYLSDWMFIDTWKSSLR